MYILFVACSVVLFRMPTGLVMCQVVALLFWVARLVIVTRRAFKAWEIRHFYYQVLHIADVSNDIFFKYSLTDNEACKFNSQQTVFWKVGSK